MQAWQATVQDDRGNALPNPVVTVYESDGVTLASIYNEDSSPKGNPFTGSIEGFVQFWAEPGEYKIEGASGAGRTEVWTVTIGEVYERVGGNIGVVVASGSSTYAGYGASARIAGYGDPDEENEWKSCPGSVMRYLDDYITSNGGKMYNRSVGGRNLGSVISNFWTEIAPYSPNTVLIGTGWSNETGSDARTKLYYFTSRMATIKKMCEDIGAKVIFFGFNPYNSSTETIRQAQWDAKKWCNENNIKVWDVAGSAYAPGYRIPEGLNDDDLHVNDAGHLAYYNACVLSDLECGNQERKVTQGIPTFVARCESDVSSSVIPVRFAIGNSAHQPKTWSVSLGIQSNGISTISAPMYSCIPSSGEYCRVEWISSTSTFEFRVGPDGNNETVVATYSGYTPEFHVGTCRHVVVYDSRTNTLIWRVNGLQVYSGNHVMSPLNAVNVFNRSTGTPASGWELSEFGVWGANIANGQYLDLLGQGQVPTGSLLCYSDFSEAGRYGVPSMNGGMYSLGIGDNGGYGVNRLSGLRVRASLSGASIPPGVWTPIPVSVENSFANSAALVKSDGIHLPEGVYHIDTAVRIAPTGQNFQFAIRIVRVSQDGSLINISANTAIMGNDAALVGSSFVSGAVENARYTSYVYQVHVMHNASGNVTIDSAIRNSFISAVRVG